MAGRGPSLHSSLVQAPSAALCLLYSLTTLHTTVSLACLGSIVGQRESQPHHAANLAIYALAACLLPQFQP